MQLIVAQIGSWAKAEDVATGVGNDGNLTQCAYELCGPWRPNGQESGPALLAHRDHLCDRGVDVPCSQQRRESRPT